MFFFFFFLLILPIAFTLSFLFLFLVLPLLAAIFFLSNLSSLLVNNNFDLLELYSRNNGTLFLQLFLEQTWKIIKFFIFFKPWVDFHKIVTSVSHMPSHCISRLEVFGTFVFASQAHISDLYLLLEVLYQTRYIFTVLFLSNEKTMGRWHMTLVVFRVITYFQAEQTTLTILFEDCFNFGAFLLGFCHHVRVMPFRLCMLFEGIGRPKGLSKL